MTETSEQQQDEGRWELDIDKLIFALDAVCSHEGISVNQAGRESGVPPEILSHMRKVNRPPSADNLIALMMWLEQGQGRTTSLVSRLARRRPPGQPANQRRREPAPITAEAEDDAVRAGAA